MDELYNHDPEIEILIKSKNSRKNLKASNDWVRNLGRNLIL